MTFPQDDNDSPCRHCGGHPIFDHYCGGPCGGFTAVLDHGRMMTAYHQALFRWHGMMDIGPCPECLDQDGHLREPYQDPPTTYCGCEYCEGHQEETPVCPRCRNHRGVLTGRWAVEPDPTATEPVPPEPLKGYEPQPGCPDLSVGGLLRSVIGRQIS
jgi:hypothetical protein